MSSLYKVRTMKGCLKQLFVSISVVFACLASCAAIYFVPATIYCEQRKHPPTAPIYPGSTLIDISSSLVGLNYSLWPPIDIDIPIPSSATYRYSTLDSPEQVLEFYSQRGDLAGTYKRNVIGSADPFGEYYVGISNWNSQLVDGITRYFIDIEWESCR